MTGANMNLVTVNVELGANDPEPDQHLEPVCPASYILHDRRCLYLYIIGRAHHKTCRSAQRTLF